MEFPYLGCQGTGSQVFRPLRGNVLCSERSLQNVFCFASGLTTPQRDLLGFPPVGSDYWTPDTISAVSHHYGAASSGWNGPEGMPPKPMDMSDYELGMSPAARASVAVRTHPEYSPGESGRPSLPPSSPERWNHLEHYYGRHTVWAAPELVSSSLTTKEQGSTPILSMAQRKQFHDEGYVVVHGIFPEELIRRCVDEMAGREAAGLPLGGFLHNPSEMSPEEQALPAESINEIPLHPRFLQCAEELLGTQDIRLVQAGLMHKAGPDAKVDQSAGHGERPSWPAGEQGLHQVKKN